MNQIFHILILFLKDDQKACNIYLTKFFTFEIKKIQDQNYTDENMKLKLEYFNYYYLYNKIERHFIILTPVEYFMIVSYLKINQSFVNNIFIKNKNGNIIIGEDNDILLKDKCLEKFIQFILLKNINFIDYIHIAFIFLSKTLKIQTNLYNFITYFNKCYEIENIKYSNNSFIQNLLDNNNLRTILKYKDENFEEYKKYVSSDNEIFNILLFGKSKLPNSIENYTEFMDLYNSIKSFNYPELKILNEKNLGIKYFEIYLTEKENYEKQVEDAKRITAESDRKAKEAEVAERQAEKAEVDERQRQAEEEAERQERLEQERQRQKKQKDKDKPKKQKDKDKPKKQKKTKTSRRSRKTKTSRRSRKTKTSRRSRKTSRRSRKTKTSRRSRKTKTSRRSRKTKTSRRSRKTKTSRRRSPKTNTSRRRSRKTKNEPSYDKNKFMRETYMNKVKMAMKIKFKDYTRLRYQGLKILERELKGMIQHLKYYLILLKRID